MASPFDLVRLADLKSWLDVSGTDDDALLARLITQISRVILTVLDRPAILPSPYTETHDGGNDVSILLRQWPVIGISSCTIDGMVIPPSQLITGGGANAQTGYVLDSSNDAPPGAMQRLSLRGFHFTGGLQNVTISYTAGYRIVNESAVIPASPPFSVSARAPYGEWASDGGVTYSNGLSLVAVTGSPVAGQYAVMNGVYNFSASDTGSTFQLTYGYVPADLASCCMDWVGERYSYRSRIGQHSKTLGGQESMAFIVKDIPDFVVSALSPYRRVVMP